MISANKPGEFRHLYGEVRRQSIETALLATVQAALEWDERTMLPPAGGEYRAEQAALLAGLVHRRWTDPQFVAQLAELAASAADAPTLAAAAENADEAAAIAATVRQLKRKIDKKIRLPQPLVEELTRTAILGQQAWQEARRKNDFPAFAPLLAKMLHLKRQQAEALGYRDCAYDALLDEFEPEALTADVARVLAGLRAELVPLVQALCGSKRQPPAGLLRGQFPVDRQEAFGRQAATAIGFDFQRGRLDVTAHPFCTTLGPNDHRITTRYDAAAFDMAFFGILHEAGHALYEQGLPTAEFGLPLGEAVSLGIHESQSRLWENFVGRSRGFWRHMLPQAQQSFPDALANAALDDFHFAVNAVRPSLIRIAADEATYNLHILVRFELEQKLLGGELPPGELPGAWRQAYLDYLGIAPATDAEGALQDVHWSAGLIGYFPTYALGNLYAAQLYAQADREIGPLEEQFARGEFRPLLDWLRAKVHCHGQRYTAAELCQRATGRPLSHASLIAHLRGRLGPLYGIA